MSEKIWKVAVLGAAGRMGSEAVRAVNTAEDMDLVAALGRGDDLQELVDSGAEIVIDLTVPDSSEANVRFAVEHGMHAVVGTTGWTPERLDSLRELLGEHPGVGVLIAPNFAIGSILATEFAAKAPATSIRLKSLRFTTRTRWMPPPAPRFTRPARWRPPVPRPAWVRARTPRHPIRWARAARWWTACTCTRYVCAAWWLTRRFCWATPASSW